MVWPSCCSLRLRIANRDSVRIANCLVWYLHHFQSNRNKIWFTDRDHLQTSYGYICHRKKLEREVVIYWFVYELVLATEIQTNPPTCRSGQHGRRTPREASLTLLFQVPLEYAPVWRKTGWRFGFKRFQHYWNPRAHWGWMTHRGATVTRTQLARLVTPWVWKPALLLVLSWVSHICFNSFFSVNCKRWNLFRFVL